jgi:hypothetical protein
MFKKIFFAGCASFVLAMLAGLTYSSVYFSMLVDFSEMVNFQTILTYYAMLSAGFILVNYGANRLVKNVRTGDFLFNLVLSGVSFAAVFMVLKMEDPIFKNEDAQLMIDYYKGFFMPLLFFPALSWMTMKPLFTLN